MLLIHGLYRFAPKRVAYRADWCLACAAPRLAWRVRTFDVGHLYGVPLLPLGFRRRWRCEACGADPRSRVQTKTAFIVLAIICAALTGAAVWVAPVEPEDAAVLWTMRFALPAVAIACVAWLRARLHETPVARVVDPLTGEECLACGGRLLGDERPRCDTCDIERW